jgi:hypothetical protein
MSDSKAEGKADHAYFQAVEKVFIELRGAPLLLSPSDWRIAKIWRGQGIPLRLVLNTLREVFDRRQREGKDKVQGLRYLKPAVAKAWKQGRELLAVPTSPPPAFDLPGRLQALGDTLVPCLPARELWRQRIPGLEGSAEAVEKALGELDGQVLVLAQVSLSKVEKESLEEDWAQARTALARRLPAAEVAASAERLRERLLRERLHFPLLSLFSPLAQPQAEVQIEPKSVAET